MAAYKIVGLKGECKEAIFELLSEHIHILRAIFNRYKIKMEKDSKESTYQRFNGGYGDPDPSNGEYSDVDDDDNDDDSARGETSKEEGFDNSDNKE